MELTKQFEEILAGVSIPKTRKQFIISAMQTAYNLGRESKWISVDTPPSPDKYYKLACNDDVYLDVFRFMPKSDGDNYAYFRSVNDDSRLDNHEVTHYCEFETDPPDWA